MVSAKSDEHIPGDRKEKGQLEGLLSVSHSGHPLAWPLMAGS